jgi:hypothetical protein
VNTESAWIADTVTDVRTVLGLTQGEAVTITWMEKDDNLSALLRCFAFISYKLNDRQDALLFHLVPIADTRAQFITVDTSTLFGIMTELKLVSCKWAAFADLRTEHWSSLVNISRYVSLNQFTGTIETDGISICVHRRRAHSLRDEAAATDVIKATRITVRSLRPYEPQAKDIVIGIDPGKVSIFHAAKKMEDGKYKSYELTRKAFVRQTGQIRARLRCQLWNQQIQPSLDALSTVTCKGLNLDRMNAYMAVWTEERDVLWTEYLKPRWARQRLRL